MILWTFLAMPDCRQKRNGQILLHVFAPATSRKRLLSFWWRVLCKYSVRLISFHILLHPFISFQSKTTTLKIKQHQKVNIKSNKDKASFKECTRYELPSGKLTVRPWKSPSFLGFIPSKWWIFHGRTVCLPEGNCIFFHSSPGTFQLQSWWMDSWLGFGGFF